MDARAWQPGDLLDMGRLLLEDICSDVVRFLHSRGDPARFGAVRIDREYALGPPGSFADLRVEPEDEPPYFLEVKYGYDAETLLRHMRRKYARLPAGHDAPVRVVVVAETGAYRDWPAIESALRETPPSDVSLEVWDESRLRSLALECFGQEIPSFAPAELVSIRERVDEGKERLAFGDEPAESHAEILLRHNLIWHFGTWRLRELRHARGTDDGAELVPTGMYEHVVAVTADLTGFSRFMRDTPDSAVVRHSLTSFYAKSRYQVINAGGMLVQFVGDEVVALFGIPDRRSGYVEDAMRTAIRLLDIGASVAHDWQRRIDHIQPRAGVHIGIAMGRAQILAMRALDQARPAVIGDCINMAKRLASLAGPGQIVVSNVVRHALQSSDYELVEREPFDAHNVGLIRPWQLVPPRASTTATPVE